jgi:hypothetical protein
MPTQASSQKNTVPSGRSDLDRRYGRIGISAVAAALPYQSKAKTPAASPTTPWPRESAEDEE